MLILTCKLGNEIINCYDGTHDKEQLKKWASKKILLCPVCGKPYEYCHGKVKTPYFRHMDKTECEDKYSESETEEHLSGKRDLFEWIKKQKGVTNAVLEGWIPETKQRPDIMFEYEGKTCVIEYQCSPIATEYVERHDLYKASGIIDIWIAGYEKYFKPNSRHKFLENYIEGYYNPLTNNFRIGNETEQGKFIEKISGRNIFKLNSFVFCNSSIIYKTYIGRNFDDLYTIHLNRSQYKNDQRLSKYQDVKNKLELSKEYLESFGVYFKEYQHFWNLEKYYVIHINNSTEIKVSKPEKFFKTIFDIKMNIIKSKLLNKIIKKYCNDNWYFYSDSNGKYVKITTIFLNTFSFEINYDYQNIDIEDENSIKDILIPCMNSCIDNAKVGNGYIRLMEVQNN